MKFKPGDEIIILDAWQGSSYSNGSRGIVEKNNAGCNRWWDVRFPKIGTHPVDGQEMEHAHVVASPLWKALT